MKKLRIILNCNVTYILLFFLLLIISLYNFLFIEKKSKYTKEERSFYCIIDKYYINGNQLKLNLSCNETLIGYYYFKSESEHLNFNKKYKIGDIIYLQGTLEEIKENKNFNIFNYKKYSNNKNIFYNLQIDNMSYIKTSSNLIYQIKNIILKRINHLKSFPYINALVLGNKDNMDKELMETYKNIGIMHLFAISGMHVGIIISISTFLLKKFKLISNIVNIAILILYYNLVGSISLLRAVLFFIINLADKIFLLNLSVLKKLFIIIFIILMINPYHLFDLGFLYSIIISGSLLILKKKINTKKTYLTKTFYISFLAFLVSLPITIYNFYEVNFLSSLYNTIIVPLVSIIVFPLSLITIIFPILDWLLCFFIEILEMLSLFFYSIDSSFIFKKPHFLVVVFYYLVIFIGLNNKKFLIFLVMILCIHFNDNKIFKSNYILFIDVKEGDSTLIHSKDHNILIDTGGTITYDNKKAKKNEYSIAKNTTIPLLKSLGISKIDTLIITHGDYDHMGEAINLINSFKVKKVIFNNGEYNELELNLIKVLETKNIPYYQNIKELNMDNKKLYFLNNKLYDNENDNSNIIYTELNNYKFLLMGDAGVEVEEDLLKKYNLTNIDVLKVGHHGSKTSSSKKFINKTNPKYSVISVGKNNRYGHPNANVLDNLENSKVYRTDQNGSIKFNIKNNKLKIETYVP